jgi:hypothetical protein
MRAALAAVAAASAALLAGCAGPTATGSALGTQAESSLLAMVSELRTGELAARTQLAGRSTWRFCDVVVTDAESSGSSVEATFSSRQPPTAASDALYERTSRQLSDAADLLTDLRVAVRRHDTASMRETTRAMSATSRRLESAAERLR